MTGQNKDLFRSNILHNIDRFGISDVSLYIVDICYTKSYGYSASTGNFEGASDLLSHHHFKTSSALYCTTSSPCTALTTPKQVQIVLSRQKLCTDLTHSLDFSKQGRGFCR